MGKSLQRRLKRMGDVLLSLAIGVVILPLVPIICWLIRLESDGPAIFRARRVGFEGREFTLYKFRSMYSDAEQRLKSLTHLNEGGPYLIRIPNDPRVTRVGRVLRKYSIDELPQVWNVLKGDMSLVGPRPQAPNEVALYTAVQRQRLEVVPGVTGLWQVTARNDPRFETMVSKDLEYINTWSLWSDLTIILKTVGVVFLGKDATLRS